MFMTPVISYLAVVICHGSYHTPAPYTPLAESLKVAGIDAYCPQLPISDPTKLNVGDPNTPDFDRGPPEGGYPQGHEETDTILSVLNPLILEQGKRVLIVGHSSGGWVATEAARPELQAKTRKDQGLTGGVIGILYIGAFIIPVGESVHSFFQPKDGSFVVPPFLDFHTFFFNDLEPKVAENWVATLTASPVLTTKLSNDAYAALPCAYLILEEFTLYRCPAGHSPHLSWTGGPVRTIQDFVKKITN
ncbi:alpha/beta-hydrolase [Xylaria longipes]|nr:alpha/beta-hydrolase [Xylaria longipes]